MSTANDAPAIHVTIGGQLEGYSVSVSFAGRLEQLPAVVKRLAAAGVQPSAPAAAGPQPKRPPLPEPWYQPDGTACCPWHQKPLREGQFGGLYCPSKAEGEHANPKGYCRFTTKA